MFFRGCLKSAPSPYRLINGSMRLKIQNRQLLSATIVLFYLIPLFFFALYSIELMPQHKSWSVLSLGLSIIAIGSLILILFIYYWEESLRKKLQEKLIHSIPLAHMDEWETKVTALDLSLNESPSHEINRKELNHLQSALKESQDAQEHLHHELQTNLQELSKFEGENKQLAASAEQCAQDFADYKVFSGEQLKQKSLQITHLQQVIEEQRIELEKRQESIQTLDTKVQDLTYEIKTLLYLNETEPVHFKFQESKKVDIQPSPFVDQDDESLNFISESQVRSSIEASALLKRCINAAQKLMGTPYYGNESSRYWEPSLPHYTIDQRRLFDILRHESRALVFVHSQRDDRLLFANNQCKNILGWSPEKFAQDFFLLFQDGLDGWKRAIQTLSSTTESQIRVLIKSKQGQEILMYCHLGNIQEGLFKNHIIGILYAA